jgi:hypothetical protein
MFTSIIFACTFVITQECVRFEDNRGPYATEERCIERIAEMLDAIRTISPDLRIVRTACRPEEGVST